MNRRHLAALLLCCVPAFASAAEPVGLDALLKQVQDAAGQDARLNQAREQRFLSDKNQQAALVAQAEAAQAAAKNKADAVRANFAANQKTIADLKAQIQAHAGDYLQVQGAVKEAAGAFRAVASESLISAQAPERLKTIDALADNDGYPPVADLERFWYALQQELTESGKVVRFKAPVVDTDGVRSEQEVVRIGSFSAFTGNRYLVFDPEALALVELTRQPAHHWRALADDFGEATDGLHAAMIDPSHGTLLVQEALRPNLRERIAQGGVIAYVIIVIGTIGALMAIYQLVYLLRVGRGVRVQLADIGRPRDDNPLGRVLAAFRGDPAQGIGDAEVLELRLSEAILREIPALERFQPLLRLIIAAGPLLGLVGTVTGMIITFQVIQEQGAGDPRLMAGGISQAMITTVLGLGVAVPMLFVNAILSARSRVLVQILDEQSAGLLARHIESGTGEGDARGA
ncbi:MotA/TolQ/ExbB proton channel family protein [Solimonas terrae]|uniref:MotA/TolQ/ExbB proton channel family protein n=1 Tax=Solimonas terrae TaxID=1396819 RepID=A0A6M2BMP9_9GAMM|nr:MotA/TolQ/ExbB proton channel family protein [Solimonas terrae]NGY03708.1 MotA/TolQ/ExbB proton channel family protein [Solimonas terrae]